MKDEIISFECVRPIESHARIIMEWRNDPLTMAMSFHTEPKIWGSFFSEFLNDYFSFPDLPPLFAWYEGNRVAFLRHNPVKSPVSNSKCCAISINVAPAWRGKGIGQQVIAAAKQWAFQQGYEEVYAEVRVENTASKKAFLHAGYTQLESTKKKFPITGEIVSIELFIASDPSKKPKQRETVFIIAEAGSNWKVGNEEQAFKMAQNLIETAAEAGVDAVKFQVFRPETIYVANAGTSDYLSAAGIKEDIRSIFSHLVMPYEMIPQLASFCNQCRVQFMASAFSKADFEVVDPFVLIHKIASYEITHLRLLELAARTQKPLIISTGAAVEEEIAWALEVIKTNNGGPVTLLQCTAKYPAAPESMHLRTIPWLKNRFKVPVGLSDHSQDPLYAPIGAVALGATVIEKHFTMDKSLPGPDHSFAVNPEELEQMVKGIRQVEKMLGSEVKIIDVSEEELRAYAQRGIQAISDIKEGDIFEEGKNIEILRPGKQIKGIHPHFIEEINKKPSKRNIPSGSGLKKGDW